MILLLATVALGGDKIEGPYKAGDTVHVTADKAWLLPDKHYSECLAKALDVEDLTVRLDRCTERAQAELTRCDAALSLCDKALAAASSQFDTDESSVNDLSLQVIDLERTLASAEADKARLRSQRNVAWAVTGGVVLTLGTTAAVALGTP